MATAKTKQQAGQAYTRTSKTSQPSRRTSSPRAHTTQQTDHDAQGPQDGVIERLALGPSANALRLLLRPEEAALALGISRATCYKLLARGELPSIVIGERLRRIPIAALNAYIATQGALQGVPGLPGVSA